MYIPSAFEITDKRTILDFLNGNPFGVLVVNGPEGIPAAAHLPFLLKEKGEQLFLEIHLAKQNELYALLQNEGKAKMIVSGAHGYVSSSVYTHVNVPTYNYQAVHLSGTVTQMTEQELLLHLREVVNGFEHDRNAPLDFDAWPKEMITAYIQEIGGFRLEVTKTEAAFKLSQNRNEVDFQRILGDLEEGSIQQQLLANEMKRNRK